MPTPMVLVLCTALAQAAPQAESPTPRHTMHGLTVAEPAVPVEPTAARIARLQHYTSERLRVVSETELLGGVASVSVGPSQPAELGAPSVVLVDPTFTYQTWGIYQGSHRLSPSAFLRETGETFRADDLDRRIERDRKKARRWMMVAGAGATSFMMGMVATPRADDLPQQIIAQQLTLGGVGVGIAGLVGASFPASHATRTTHYPSAVLERSDAEAMAERHNTALQQRLSLTEEDLLVLELADQL